VSLWGSQFQFVVNTGLQCITIVVLVFTCIAAFKQAKAARTLTEATKVQIKTSEEQAKAAMEQVSVAKRQITETVRPILTVRLINLIELGDGSTDMSLKVTNEGAGVALDVWWMYGKPGIDPDQRNRVEEGIIPPGEERVLRVHGPRTAHEGLLIVYMSLSGITSGTGFDWKGGDAALTYYPELNDWAKSLLGRVLGSRPSR
jgi:hypothetical protein